MIFLSTFLIAILSAALGTFAAGLVAAGGVKWYRISNFEGGSGYFVVFMGLFGAVAGLVIGLVTPLAIWADSGSGFLKGLALAWGIILAIAGVIAAISRLLADVPPTIDGQELLLVVDVRWPADQTVRPVAGPGEAFLVFGSLSGSVLRKSERGILWVGEATQVDGRWTARGAANVFTSRGRRTLAIHAGPSLTESFLVPLPAYPRSRSRQWSDWLPRPQTQAPGPKLSYRFRAQPWSDPIKCETFGPFEITTVTRRIFESVDRGVQLVDSEDRFRITHRGRPVVFGDIPDDPAGAPPANMIATFPGNPATLLVNISSAYGPGKIHLAHGDGDTARVEFVADSTPIPSLIYLGPGTPGDDSRIKRNRRQIDRDGIFHVAPRGVLDSRSMTGCRYNSPPGQIEAGDFKPLMLSPDQRSYVRVTLTNQVQMQPNVTATDFIADRSDVLPIDRRRMRFTRIEQIDAAWVLHHFQWQADGAGIDRLVERNDFAPLPYRGDLTHDTTERPTYEVNRVTAGMWPILDGLLVSKFQAESKIVDGSFDHDFLLDGFKVTTCCIEGSKYVMVRFDATMPAARVAGIAAGLDAELATGRYDALFDPG